MKLACSLVYLGIDDFKGDCHSFGLVFLLAHQSGCSLVRWLALFMECDREHQGPTENREAKIINVRLLLLLLICVYNFSSCSFKKKIKQHIESKSEYLFFISFSNSKFPSFVRSIEQASERGK